MKTFCVINQFADKNFSVWDMNYASGTLVGIYPVANFEHGKHKSPDVNHISGMVVNLNAVAQGERSANNNENPCRNVGKQVFQGDSQTGR